MQCPVCPANGYVIATSATDYHIARCESCRLVFVDPMPSEEELTKFYQGFTYALPSEDQLEQQRNFVVNGTDEFMKTVRDLAPKAVSILDYGGGLGFFADALAKHFGHVTYFDLDDHARSYAHEKMDGHFAIAETGEEALAGRYDVILLNQVIEHIPDPIAFLAPFRRALNPGGVMIVTTPNNDSDDHWFRPDLLHHYLGTVALSSTRALGRLAQDSWLCCDPPRHLFAFNSDNLGTLMKRAGFDTLRSESIYFDRDPYGQPKYRWNGIGSPKKAALSILYLLSLVTAPWARLADRKHRRGSTLIGYYT